jgi:hypothetical protein
VVGVLRVVVETDGRLWDRFTGNQNEQQNDGDDNEGPAYDKLHHPYGELSSSSSTCTQRCQEVNDLLERMQKDGLQQPVGFTSGTGEEWRE